MKTQQELCAVCCHSWDVHVGLFKEAQRKSLAKARCCCQPRRRQFFSMTSVWPQTWCRKLYPCSSSAPCPALLLFTADPGVVFFLRDQVQPFCGEVRTGANMIERIWLVCDSATALHVQNGDLGRWECKACGHLVSIDMNSLI